jgi:hypothetical protein
MKKVGFVVFIIALIIGVSLAGLFSWGKASAEGFSFNLNFGRGVKGSGNVSTENRDVKGFKSIDVSGVFNVEIVAQKDFSVQVEADDNLLQFIKTEVRNGVLEISTTQRIKSKNGLKIRISAPDLEGIEASGVAKILVTDLKNAAFKVDTSGASKVELAGVTDKLNIEVSGASKIEAENLTARTATIDSSGASKINVFATEAVNVDASGASKITYSGGATNVTKNTSGASSVSAK